MDFNRIVLELNIEAFKKELNESTKFRAYEQGEMNRTSSIDFKNTDGFNPWTLTNKIKINSTTLC